MRYLLPTLVLAFFISLVAIYRTHSSSITPPVQALQAVQAGQTFVSYARAVEAFMFKTPSFTGSISAAQLAAQGTPFSDAFLERAGNAVTVFGVAGRTVTTYATLPTGAINTIVSMTKADAAFGLSSGTTWTSAAPGSSPQVLAAMVPAGSVVSVIQIGQ